MDHLPLCSRLMNDGRLLVAFRPSRREPSCIGGSKSKNISWLYEEYHHYMKNQPPELASNPVLTLPPNAFVDLPNSTFNINTTSCNCPLACQETAYTLTETIARNEPRQWSTCVAFFSLTFDFTQEIVLETSAILLADLLASIGGIMGLLTGLSLYTFAIYLEETLVRLYGRVKVWRRRNGRVPAKKSCPASVHVMDLEAGE